MELSAIIKKVRSALVMSQERLAQGLHGGFTSVNRWEHNHTKPNKMAHHALMNFAMPKMSVMN